MTHEIRLYPEVLELAGILEQRWPEFTHRPGTIVNESAGGAPAGAGEGGDGGDGGAGEGGEQPAPLTADDINQAFDTRFDQLRQELVPLVGGEGEGGGEGEIEGEPDYAALAQQFIQEAEANGGEISAEDLQGFVQSQSQAAVQQALSEALPQALEQALAPVHDRFLQQDADALEQRYPALADPETQSAVVQEAVRFAQQLGNPELARNPQVVEQAYLAWCARNGTAAVPASGEGDAQLEGGGGGNPGDAGDGPSIQEQIVSAGGRGGDLFSGAF